MHCAWSICLGRAEEHAASTDDSFRARYGPWAVVAGGSDGTGAAFSRQLARRRVNVVLIARRAPLLDELAGELRAEYGVDARAVACDLSAPDAIATLRAQTDDIEVGLLVYNAGADPRMTQYLDTSLDDLHAMVHRNAATVVDAVHHYGAGIGGARARWRDPRHLRRGMGGRQPSRHLRGDEGIRPHPRGGAVAGGANGASTSSRSCSARPTPRHTDACSRRTGATSPAGLADPDTVVTDALDHLSDGPTRLAGCPTPEGPRPSARWPVATP